MRYQCVALALCLGVLLGCQEAAQEKSEGETAVSTIQKQTKASSEQIEQVLSQMTLEEKINMVSGLGFNMNFSEAEDFEKVPGAAGYTYPIPRLGVPSIVLADGPAGLRIWPERKGHNRTYYATAFPIASALASTWDVEVLRAFGHAVGHEAREYGVDLWLAPGMNIHRDPRGGRNFEYYSEDPYLSGKMAAATVNGIQAEGVGATIKHYVANNQETNRVTVDTKVSERTLREIYLRGFEIAVKESKPWSIMSSYNQVNGTTVSENKPLLTEVLRDEWGFDGVVMTDWFGGYQSVEQMKAGNELLMPGVKERTDEIRAAVESGDLDVAVLDRNVRIILDVVFRTLSANDHEPSDNPDLAASAQKARQAAAEGVVLLKNDQQTLPISPDLKVAAFGTGSYDFIAGGVGSGDVNEAYTISLVDGLDARSVKLDPDLQATYEAYAIEEKAKLPEKEIFFQLTPPIPEMPLDEEQLAQAVARNDIAMITLSRDSGEFQDRELDGDFYLTDAEQSMIDAVSSAFHAAEKRVVMVINSGNVIEVASWRDKVDAIVLPWMGGQEAGHAVVDVLLGSINPSGKLPTTFPVTYDDVPSSKNFPGVELEGEGRSFGGGLMVAKPSEVTYAEGIYVGYRYYDTFDVTPAYPFGFGLSYTEFEYSNVALSSEVFEDSIDVSVTVTNKGSVAGRESVQLYVSAPNAKQHKPIKELKGFAKTGLLQPGESETVRMTLSAASLASFYDDQAAWVADAGQYTVHLAASSRDVRQSTGFSLLSDIVVDGGLTELSPEENPDSFIPNGK